MKVTFGRIWRLLISVVGLLGVFET